MIYSKITLKIKYYEHYFSFLGLYTKKISPSINLYIAAASSPQKRTEDISRLQSNYREMVK